MKCYYEVLCIEREADSSEIKTAYRKLALKWHPDKNLTNSEEAKEQFQTVQNAYEVLSDPQERAWYDSHREQLLRGAGTSFSDNSVDLIPFFTPSCYKGFGDDEKSFYSVYREVFHKLAAEEADYLDDPEDVSSIPMFGKSDTEYESVHEFYSYWMSFSTSKSYVWLDKYDIREADNRRVLKIIEKENNKIRQKARKERNEEIRNLVNFVRRRDKRVAAHSKLLLEKAEENKKKAEQMRRDRLVLRQKELEEIKKREGDNKAYAMSDFHEQLDQIEKNLVEEFGHSDEETLTGPSDDEDPSNDAQENDTASNCTEEQSSKGKSYKGSQNLYCTACSKFFKTIKSFQNHENSKKHKENVLNMKLETDLGFSDDDKSNKDEEDSDIAVSSSKNIPDSDELKDDVTDDEAQIQSKKKKKKNKKKPKLLESNESDVDEETNLENLNSETRNRRGRKVKAADKAAAKKKSLQKEKSEDKESIDDTDKKDGDENSKSSEGLTSLNGDISAPLTNDASESVSKKSLTKRKISNKNKEKKLSQKDKELLVNSIDITDIDTSHCCAICKNEFNSKNKLFDHLKKTGHQIYLPQSQASTAKPSKKKGTKK